MLGLPSFLAVVGCLALVVSLFSGGPMAKASNFFSLLIGLVFIGIAVMLSSFIPSQLPGTTTTERRVGSIDLQAML